MTRRTLVLISLLGVVVVGMTRPRGARCRGTRNRAATLYPVGRSDPNHDARMRIGGEAPRRWTHS